MRVLYLSYDGMTDPLGSSQVIPYLRGLAERGHQIIIVSAEKPDRFQQFSQETGAVLRAAGIEWHPIRYHKMPPVLSTVWDAGSMFMAGWRLRQRYEMIHARSYVAALAAWLLKRTLGVKFLFDMRGFWADERVDGGLWNLENPVFWAVFKFFKHMERRFLTESDATVSLTHRGLEEMKRWPYAKETSPVTVIPCCVDIEKFSKPLPDQSSQLRKKLGFLPHDKILVYLGSLGTWYLLDEMLEFYQAARQVDPTWRLLIITPDDPEIVKKRNIPGVTLTRCRHSEAPLYLSLADAGLFFIRPAYSKISSSPTKLGELLAMGIPVIANAGVGDVDRIFEKYRVGYLLKDLSPSEMVRGAGMLAEVKKIPPEDIRAAAKDYFSLEKGVDLYQGIYLGLSSRPR